MNPYSAIAILMFVVSMPNWSMGQEASNDETPSVKTLIQFCATGDVPRAEKEFGILDKQLRSLPKEARFVIHLGDFKAGATPCSDELYLRVATLLKTSPKPLFIVPGDNEWNDCEDPDAAWKLWNKHFLKLDQHWDHRLKVAHQEIRKENFAFVENRVLFVGINLVGGRVHDEIEWAVRQKQDLRWLTENLALHSENVDSFVLMAQSMPSLPLKEFFEGFEQLARKFAKPVLYLHGDGHRWLNDRPFRSRNIYRVQVDQGSIAPPVLVKVTDDPYEPFKFERRR